MARLGRTAARAAAVGWDVRGEAVGASHEMGSELRPGADRARRAKARWRAGMGADRAETRSG